MRPNATHSSPRSKLFLPRYPLSRWTWLRKIAGDVVDGHEALQHRRGGVVGRASPSRGKIPPPPTSLPSSSAAEHQLHLFGRARRTLTLSVVYPQDMRKAIGTMKSLAVDFERDGKSDKASERDCIIPIRPHP